MAGVVCIAKVEPLRAYMEQRISFGLEQKSCFIGASLPLNMVIVLLGAV